MIDRIKSYFGEAHQELKHVNWPTRTEAVRLTGIVVALSVFLALFLAGFDVLFTYVLRNLLNI